MIHGPRDRPARYLLGVEKRSARDCVEHLDRNIANAKLDLQHDLLLIRIMVWNQAKVIPSDMPSPKAQISIQLLIQYAWWLTRGCEPDERRDEARLPFQHYQIPVHLISLFLSQVPHGQV